MPNYTFTVHIGGYGDTPEEAWEDAAAAFTMDPGSCPEKDCIQEEPEG